MASFYIRRNHPQPGVLTLCKVSNGAFTAREMVVNEAAFLAAVATLVDNLSPADRARLRRQAAPQETPPPDSGEPKGFKVRKAASAAAV